MHRLDATVVTGGEEAAGDVDARVAPEFAVALERWAEVDALGVSEQPGGVVVFVAFDGGDAKGDVEGAAMPPKTAARGRRQRSSEEKVTRFRVRKVR